MSVTISEIIRVRRIQNTFFKVPKNMSNIINNMKEKMPEIILSLKCLIINVEDERVLISDLKITIQIMKFKKQ